MSADDFMFMKDSIAHSKKLMEKKYLLRALKPCMDNKLLLRVASQLIFVVSMSNSIHHG